MNHHSMHNLIWIYNPGVLCNGGTWPPYKPAELPRRQAFYVGDTCCDIVGMDLYDWDWINKGTYSPGGIDYGITYRNAWNVMKAISSTRMIALSECQGLPDPVKSFTDSTYAPWLYALPWYSDANNGVPCTVLTARANNSYMINASDLPDFNLPTSVVSPKSIMFRHQTLMELHEGRLVFSVADQSVAGLTIVDIKGKITLSATIQPGQTGLSIKSLPAGLFVCLLTTGSSTSNLIIAIDR